MLTFFRRIRKGLLDGGSTSKYLLYAVGEILLVMIGILLALQVNNWNEHRKERILENRVSSQLYEELINCYSYSSEELDFYRLQARHLEEFISEGGNLNIDSFKISLIKLWPVDSFSVLTYLIDFTGFYDPTLNLYTSFVNDGSISIINDENFVYDLENIYVGGKNRMDRLYEREIRLNHEIGKYVSETYGEILSSTSYLEDKKWDKKTEEIILQSLINDGPIRYRLRDKLMILRSKMLILNRDIITPIEELISEYTHMSE